MSAAGPHRVQSRAEGRPNHQHAPGQAVRQPAGTEPHPGHWALLQSPGTQGNSMQCSEPSYSTALIGLKGNNESVRPERALVFICGSIFGLLVDSAICSWVRLNLPFSFQIEHISGLIKLSKVRFLCHPNSFLLHLLLLFCCCFFKEASPSCLCVSAGRRWEEVIADDLGQEVPR